VDESVVDRVLDDVLDRVGVLLLGLDHDGVEPAPEDVVAPPVAFVEGAGIGAVEIAHAVREVGLRSLDDQVVVVSHQAADVDAPAVAPPDATQDVEEDDAIPVVHDDRRLVVPARRDVVVRACGEVAAWTSHLLRR
jgi:hypothetical protein